MAPFSLYWINSIKQGTNQKETLEYAEGQSRSLHICSLLCWLPATDELTHLRRKLEHRCTDDERCGVVFGCQCQSVSSCHSPQGTVSQDSLRTNDHLWEEKNHEHLGVET